MLEHQHSVHVSFSYYNMHLINLLTFLFVLVPRRHRNKGRRSGRSYSLDVIKDLVQFITSSADINGLPMPVPSSGGSGTPPIYLPAQESKASLYREYTRASQESEKPFVGRTKFYEVWQQCCPQFLTVRTDICTKCDQHRRQIQEAASDEEKEESLESFQQHLRQVKKKRTLYNESV